MTSQLKKDNYFRDRFVTKHIIPYTLIVLFIGIILGAIVATVALAHQVEILYSHMHTTQTKVGVSTFGVFTALLGLNHYLLS
jgi:hypothetical protein